MSKRRYAIVGLAGLCAAVGTLVAVPKSRHAIRHAIDRHSHVRFSNVAAVPLVAVAPTRAAADLPDTDQRLAPRPFAEVAIGPLAPPRLDAGGFAAPAATTARSVAAAPALDETTVTEAAPPKADDGVLIPDLAGARQALRHYHDGDLVGGDDFARLTSGPLRTALDWAAVRLASRQAGPDRLQAFLDAHADWPLRSWVDRRIEEARVAPYDAARVLALFKTSAPQTSPAR